MTTMFTVDGPYNVPCYRGRAGRTITDDNTQDFWKRNPHLTGLRGCYVFGIRAGKGFTPAYVGKATKSYKQEVFSPHKLSKYQQFLADYRKGMPVLFFVVAPKKRGTPNSSHIGKLEDFLIQAGVAANEDLLNVKGTKEEQWDLRSYSRRERKNLDRREAVSSNYEACWLIITTNIEQRSSNGRR